MNPPITVCLTSCGRYDLLERTLASFFKYNTYPIHEFIVREDGPLGQLRDVCGKYSCHTDFGTHIGQINSADTLMKLSDTEWVMWLEDDWEFYRPGFIEASLEIMQHRSEILQVWLRERNDTNGHPLEGDYLSTNYHWKGFSFNPGLRRKSDWLKIGGYRHTVGKKEGAGAEQQIGRKYASLGYKAAITSQGYVRHIGHGRHVK